MYFQKCKLCTSESATVYLDIFGQINSHKNIPAIISKHLWFDFQPSDELQLICNQCWNSLYEFNTFYNTVAEIHHNEKGCSSKDDELDDPFGPDLLAENDDSTDCNTKSEFLEVIKTEPCDDLVKSVALDIDVLGENVPNATEQGNLLNIEQQDLSLTRESVPTTQRPRRNNTKAIYNDELTSDEEQAESVAEQKNNDVKPMSQNASRRKRLESSDFEDEVTEGSVIDEIAVKPARAKRKRDTKLFEHIDEFVCYICPDRVEFDRFYHATVHYKEFHKEPAYIKCKSCGKRCYTPGNLISHVAVHTDPDKYRCQICGKQNDQQVALVKHMRIHRPEMEEKLPIRCRLCPRRFSTDKKRDRHEKHHSRKPMEKPPRVMGRDEEILEFYKRIICEICDQQRMVDDNIADVEYENMQDLKKHMRDVHNDKGYLKCHICDKKCNIRSVLLIHKDFHLNPEKYRCSVCGNVYQNLQKHKQGAHASPGEASFCCEHCGKALTSEKSLKSHVDRKHAVKDTICDICNKPFSKSMLESHKRVVHENASYMCTHCPRMFRSKFSLNRHLEEHEDKVRERVKCVVCGLTFKHKYILTKHIDSVHTKEAPVSCDVCGKKFKSKHHLWSHKSDTCNTRRYDCTICGRVFKVKVRLTEHMTTHTGKSLYQCTFCPMTFSFQSILYTHRKKAHYEQWLELQAKREEGVKFKVLEAPT
ncbi:transcription factor grauzone-like [Toxorhynchites rutilus septentrionalis]|uniref:transcription factor grauzone-like n=1 Tax=Toxorhynchites rutilus septentrionalis TaxID=329112 RepID=UPI002478A5A1|nr:transcription factor grauzone-like [Toxorhynchites rutilus septentrionalis]